MAPPSRDDLPGGSLLSVRGMSVEKGIRRKCH